MGKPSNYLRGMSEQELDLYRKQTEIELMRLPLVQFEYQTKKDWMVVLALCAVVAFGVAAFALQFEADKTSEFQQIQGWGRNFLMVIIGGLTAIISGGSKTGGSGKNKESDSKNS